MSHVSDVTVTQPENNTIDHAYMEGADTYLAQVGEWGQAPQLAP